MILIEEHFSTPEFADPAAAKLPWQAQYVARLREFGEQRLAMMDELGIQMQVLSLAGPVAQDDPDPARARAANDTLAGIVAAHPDRFAGFAALPLRSPAAAADELERCVSELGFVGAMVNGHTGGRYLDDEELDVVLARAERLGAPIYLHPANAADTSAVYRDHPELLGPTWAWGVEVATQTLRMVFARCFERHPGLTLVIGHMGETLPFYLWRLDNRWEAAESVPALELRPSEYIRRNVMITTSGVCDEAPLRCSIEALGVDRVMLAGDYPFEDQATVRAFIDSVNLSAEDRAKLAHGNAEKVFGLSGAA